MKIALVQKTLNCLDDNNKILLLHHYFRSGTRLSCLESKMPHGSEKPFRSVDQEIREKREVQKMLKHTYRNKNYSRTRRKIFFSHDTRVP